ncbi:MAG TPA: hypothetical protein DER09_10315 [Prolixibacteraceae bacterium]|nr:hypothetical protein [Prolixibacteraceae bacterium]
MENKKLLGYILKDLLELEEMFDEKTCLQFDEIETEFIQNRVKSARKLVQLYIGHPDEKTEEPRRVKAEPLIKIDEVEEPVKVVQKPVTPVLRDEHQPVPGVIVNGIMEYLEDTINEIAEEDGGNMPEAEEEDEWQQPEPEKRFQTNKSEAEQQELRLDETTDDDQHNKRLGDSFLKEKSVNDLVSADAQKLENKISNMPVSSIQASVGINDRFQYIRELFDGDADKFAETVANLDSMSNLKDAVVYLQQNFKWKKTEVSLKFVTLIKRRFPQ